MASFFTTRKRSSQVSVCPQGCVWQTFPWADTPLAEGQPAGGTHPTGMHSCFAMGQL